jgi:1,2-phenylacetyl-CoA epoxidase catalytic subunit
MPVRREYPPRSISAADVREGRVDVHYRKTLARLLAAHAMAEKLTALGYERAMNLNHDPALAEVLKKNLAEERKHAHLVYRALEQVGISEQSADRSMIPALKAPSFEAPSYFAGKAEGELDLLMASLSLDSTGLIMIGVNYRESSFTPHARAADIILEEEADHDLFAGEHLTRAAERFGPEAVQAAMRRWLPWAVNFFGPPGSGFTYDCMRFGLKVRDNAELADLFLAMLGKKCDQIGIAIPRLTAEYPHALAE